MFWLASAIAAVDSDPWLLHPDTVVLRLPSRHSLMALALVTATLGVAALLLPDWLRVGRRRVLVWVGGATTFALVFLGTSFIRPGVHFLAVLLALGSPLLVTLIWLRLRPEGSATGTGARTPARRWSHWFSCCSSARACSR